MKSIFMSSIGRATVLATGLVLAFATPGWAKKQAAITRPKFDPTAKRVEMFEGINTKTLNVKMVPHNSLGGNVVIENLSNKPLTVELPEAFVGVQVARQFGGGGARGGGVGVGGGAAAGGAAQPIGGGLGGGGGQIGGGMGMFSIPPERTVKVPYHSVCLEHGKREPDSNMTYRVLPVDQYTDNDQLSGLLTLVGTREIDPQAAQAAAWFLSNNMTWEQLAAKTSTEVPGLDEPYFSAQSLAAARQLVSMAQGVAREKVAEREKTGESKKAPRSEDRAIRGR